MVDNSKLKKALLWEKEGMLGEALSSLRDVALDKSYAKLLPIIDLNVERIVQKVKMDKTFSHLKVEAVYENSQNPSTYSNGHYAVKGVPLISLTAISTRLDRVYKTIETLTKQTLNPHSINLYVSTDPYLIDEGVDSKNPALKKIADLGANIYIVDNIGPYRKQYPIIKQLKDANANPSTPFVTVDDDVLYPPTIIERLVKELDSTDSVVAHRGRAITFDNNQLQPYKNFSIPKREKNIFNMGTGRNGIIYRLGFFPTNYEDYMGHVLAPTADDLWCKYVTTAYCVETAILEPRAATDPSLDFKETMPSDKRGLFHNYNAKGRNDIAMTALETFFSKSSRGIEVLSGI